MTPFDREIAARTIWMEARGENEAGLRAVAHVLINRLRSGRWKQNGASTLTLVCLADRQFSCWNADRADSNRERMATLPDNDSILNLCRGMIDAAAAGEQDPTLGAMHYYSIFMPVPPDWVASGKFTAQIGKHRFFRDIP